MGPRPEGHGEESDPDIEILSNTLLLQWGHVQKDMESKRGSEDGGDDIVLQWGHVQKDMERSPSHRGSCSNR